MIVSNSWKIAAFAPMPSASDRIGDGREDRTSSQQPQPIAHVAHHGVGELHPAVIAADFLVLLDAAHRAKRGVARLRQGVMPRGDVQLDLPLDVDTAAPHRARARPRSRGTTIAAEAAARSASGRIASHVSGSATTSEIAPDRRCQSAVSFCSWRRPMRVNE